MKELDRLIGSSASEIAQESGANCILLITRPQSEEIKIPIDLTLFRQEGSEVNRSKHRLEIYRLPPGSIAQIRRILIEAVDQGILREGDYVFCVADKSLGIEFDGLFLLFKIDKKFLEMSKKELWKGVKADVFEATLNIAREISKEGREGRRVGTAFVIGDSDRVLKLSSQLILNPFEGQAPDKRNITDPALKETIKELAQLDGVFIIGANGYIHASGRYLEPTVKVDLKGFGGRHMTCAATTKETDAIAIAVSESGGVIRVFKDGKIILEEIPESEEKENVEK